MIYNYAFCLWVLFRQAKTHRVQELCWLFILLSLAPSYLEKWLILKEMCVINSRQSLQIKLALKAKGD